MVSAKREPSSGLRVAMLIPAVVDKARQPDRVTRGCERWRGGTHAQKKEETRRNLSARGWCPSASHSRPRGACNIPCPEETIL